MRRGLFITVEGIEGAGKSTQVEHIQEYLEETGKDVVVTREPGGTAIGEAVRALLLDPGSGGMADDTELLMMFSSRAEHIAKVIQPALSADKCVVCDRFTDATYAYQGGGRGIPYHRISILEDWVQGALHPDLTFVLDVPVTIGLERARRRSGKDRFEREDIAFFNRVRDAYIERVRQEPERYHLIDAAPPSTAVRASIMEVLEACVG
jgi:dTMP kinase